MQDPKVSVGKGLSEIFTLFGVIYTLTTLTLYTISLYY